MQIKTKYSIGDIVKIIDVQGNESIVQITEISVRCNENSIKVSYASGNYMKLDYDVYTGEEIMVEQPISEEKSDAPVAYIKCNMTPEENSKKLT